MNGVYGVRTTLCKRLLELHQVKEAYVIYQQSRVAEKDYHGCWDVAIDLAKADAEIAGIRLALNSIKAEFGTDAGT